MRISILILCLSIAFYGISGNCLPPEKLEIARNKEIANSDFIMIGNVISINDDSKTITVVVKEVFKGRFPDNSTIIMENNIYCEPYVNTTGEWLFYGKVEYGEYKFNECGLSRSLQYPELNRYFKEIPPPISDRKLRYGAEAEAQIKYNEKWIKVCQNAKNLLAEELQILRALKKPKR